MGKISILMAVHNGEKYIVQAINSALNQTFQDFKLFICANACTDNTISIVGQIMQNHPQKDKIYLTTLPYANKSNALNYLLDICDGEYVAILDADDYWHTTKLEKQIIYTQNHDIIGTQTYYVSYISAIMQLSNPVPETNQEIRESILQNHRNPIINSSVLINRKYIRNGTRWDKELDGVEDFKLWAELAIFTNAKFYNIPEKLTYHRLHADSHFNNTSYQEDKLAQIKQYINDNKFNK